jgi:cell division FtsZ-interacting protein ZapD
MSFTPTTSKTHATLVSAVATRQGQTLSSSELKELVRQAAPDLGKNIQWFIPTDHCNNHRPKGACICAMTDAAPLTKLSRGLFQVR